MRPKQNTCAQCGKQLNTEGEEASQWLNRWYCGPCTRLLTVETVIPMTDHTRPRRAGNPLQTCTEPLLMWDANRSKSSRRYDGRHDNFTEQAIGIIEDGA